MRLAVKLAGVPLGLLLAFVLVVGATTGIDGQQGSCGAAAPVTAGQLTSGQQQFAGELVARTGLDGDVVAAWELAEESGSYAAARAAANNNDWLNVGYTDSGTYGSTDSVWSDPVTAADATGGWLHGQDTIPGYGTASAGVQAILATAGQPAAVEIAAIQASGWATSGYPDLPGLYASVASGPGGAAVPVSLNLGPSVACAASVAETLTPGATASILPSGLASVPQGAPAAVQKMIAAGNEITSYPYSFGGGHCVAAMQVPPGPGSCPGDEANGGPGYDCSSATSFVLWGGGLGQSLLGGEVDASGALESVGDSGPGEWVTIYAGESGGQGHAFIEVAGAVLDTVHGHATHPAGTGPRWQPAAEIAYELAHGSFVARHPRGL